MSFKWTTVGTLLLYASQMKVKETGIEYRKSHLIRQSPIKIGFSDATSNFVPTKAKSLKGAPFFVKNKLNLF